MKRLDSVIVSCRSDDSDYSDDEIKPIQRRRIKNAISSSSSEEVLDKLHEMSIGGNEKVDTVITDRKKFSYWAQSFTDRQKEFQNSHISYSSDSDEGNEQIKNTTIDKSKRTNKQTRSSGKISDKENIPLDEKNVIVLSSPEKSRPYWARSFTDRQKEFQNSHISYSSDSDEGNEQIKNTTVDKSKRTNKQKGYSGKRSYKENIPVDEKNVIVLSSPEKSCPPIISCSDSDNSDNKYDGKQNEQKNKIKQRNKDTYYSQSLCLLKKEKQIGEFRLSFLSSLEENTYGIPLDAKAEYYVTNFKKSMQQLAIFLFQYFNLNVFKKKLTNCEITWSGRLTSAAGITKQRIIRTTVDNETVFKRVAAIQLSKVFITKPHILRDVMAHEMCHVATWLIDNVRTSHGTAWKAWTDVFHKTFPEIPKINVRHHYARNWKYIYECGCGRELGKMTKLPSNQIKVCKYCGREVVLKSVNGRPPKETNEFQKFVLSEYQAVAKSNPDKPKHEIMKILGATWQQKKGEKNDS